MKYKKYKDLYFLAEKSRYENAGDFGEQILKSGLELLTSCLADGNLKYKIFYY